MDWTPQTVATAAAEATSAGEATNASELDIFSTVANVCVITRVTKVNKWSMQI